MLLLHFIYVKRFNCTQQALLTMDWLNLVSISPSSQSKASVLRRNSSVILLEQRVERRWMLNSRVAFSWACLLNWSSPFTITSFLLNSWTPTKTKIFMCDYKATNGLLWSTNVKSSATTRKNNLDYINRCKFCQAWSHFFSQHIHKDVKVAFIISLHRYATRQR